MTTDNIVMSSSAVQCSSVSHFPRKRL